jgi:transcriptional regulator with XRE-family HTH domain
MCPPHLQRKRSSAYVLALGASIRARRMRLRQTRVELARRSRLSEAKIIDVEDGDPNVDLLELVAIAAALEIPLRRLLQRAERKVASLGSRKGRRKRPPKPADKH